MVDFTFDGGGPPIYSEPHIELVEFIKPDEARQIWENALKFILALLHTIPEAQYFTTENNVQLFDQELIQGYHPAFLEFIAFEDNRPDGSILQRVHYVNPYLWQQEGLTGLQGQHKHNLMVRTWNRFVSNPTAKGLRKLLASINSLLKSLCQVVPGGNAIQEIKEAAENAVSVTEGFLQD